MRESSLYAVSLFANEVQQVSLVAGERSLDPERENMRLRIRIGKKRSSKNILRKKKRDRHHRFAFFPKRLSNGTVVWLETYRRFHNYYGEYNTRSRYDQAKPAVSIERDTERQPRRWRQSGHESNDNGRGKYSATPYAMLYIALCVIIAWYKAEL